jgi:hypothetical protein
MVTPHMADAESLPEPLNCQAKDIVRRNLSTIFGQRGMIDSTRLRAAMMLIGLAGSALVGCD